jgi:hypothetical protein
LEKAVRDLRSFGVSQRIVEQAVLGFNTKSRRYDHEPGAANFLPSEQVAHASTAASS